MLRFGKALSILMAIVLLSLVAIPMDAQSPAIVYGIFFYLPSCPHCHEVMENHWPSIQAQFADQLQVLFVDVSTTAGANLMRTAREALQISENGVPMLILGTEVLVGAVEIPQRAPTLIRMGLERGGIAHPAVPGISGYFAAPQQIAVTSEPAFDIANLLALIVLVGLVGVMAAAVVTGWRCVIYGDKRLLNRFASKWGLWALRIGTALGLLLALLLAVGAADESGIRLIGAGILLLMLLLLGLTWMTQTLRGLARSFVPLVILIGLIVASYLAYVELTLSDASCGAFGDCNTVQQSPYARIFGIPVGILGVVGYLVMFMTVIADQVKHAPVTNVLLLLFGLVGVAFSIYLTFLEPFVIGATCLWCLTSAVCMALILWAALPAGVPTLRAVIRGERLHTAH